MLTCLWFPAVATAASFDPDLTWRTLRTEHFQIHFHQGIEQVADEFSLMVEDAQEYVSRIRNAGCICAGAYSPVVLGDYVAGPSHALPTGGSARFSSPLIVQDFIKFSSVIALGDDEIDRIGPAAITIAGNEGLTGHARAVSQRLKKKSGTNA